MKFFRIIVVGLIGAASASADVVFQGYMKTAGKPLFILSVDKERTSGWISVGQKIDDVSILAFDTGTEILTIERGGEQKGIRLVGSRIADFSETAKAPILISIGNGEQISVGDDLAMMDALKKKFELVAAMVPQPSITFRPPRASTIDRLKVVMDLCREAGIKRFSISSQ